MWPNSQETVDLVTFIKEILNGKIHFLCSVKRFHKNEMIVNPGKFLGFVINRLGNRKWEIHAKWDKSIASIKSVTLLGFQIHNRLNFDRQVSTLCKKAAATLHKIFENTDFHWPAFSRNQWKLVFSHILCSVKLNAFSRFSSFTNLSSKKTLIEAFVYSQFNYCPLVWHFYSSHVNKKNWIYTKKSLKISLQWLLKQLRKSSGES